MSVNYKQLNSFICAIGHFPSNTPNRWELVSEYIKSDCNELDYEDLQVSLGECGHGKLKIFNLRDGQECRTMNRLLETKYPGLLNKDTSSFLFKRSGKTAFKSILLLPTSSQCCGKTLKYDNRPSFPIVYTTKGSFVGALFHGECLVCKTKHFPGYQVKSTGEKVYHDPKASRYFQVTSKTVFENGLLTDTSNSIWVEGSTFHARAKIYNLNFGDGDKDRLQQLQEFARTKDGGWQLNEQRLNDAWFLWVVVNYFNSKGTLQTIDISISDGYKDASHRFDVEGICNIMWQDICLSNNRWVEHACKTPGCTEGYVTVDGNEYLKRSKCAFPLEKVKLRKDLPEIFKGCPNSPLPGGKHQAPSKLCAVHSGEADKEIDYPPEYVSNKSERGLQPEDVMSDKVGCKKKKNISLFYETTAGMLALIRPCGIVVNMTEMFTSESCTQVFLFLLRTFCSNIADVQRLRYIGYDRACGFVPYLRNQAKNGSAGAKLLLDNVKFLVDIFHVSKHTEDVCMPPDNPNCLYHPSLPAFDEIRGVNTESCEQGFKRLNQYLLLTRKMTQFKRNVLFWFVNDRYNEDLERELKRKGLL